MDVMLPYPDFAIRLVACMEYKMDKYVSAADMAAHVGVCPGTVYRILGGETKNMLVTTLYKFCLTLGISPNFLLGRVGPRCAIEKYAAKAVKDAYRGRN